MNLSSMTKIDFNDPVPVLGKKVEAKKEVVTNPSETWKTYAGSPGMMINGLGQLRTNFEEPKEEPGLVIANAKSIMDAFNQAANRLARQMDPLKAPPLVAISGLAAANGSIQSDRIVTGSCTFNFQQGVLSTDNNLVAPPPLQKIHKVISDSFSHAKKKPNWRWDHPLYPGMYVAATVNPNEKTTFPDPDRLACYIKYWDGLDWYFDKPGSIDYQKVYTGHAVLWNPVETERLGLNK